MRLSAPAAQRHSHLPGDEEMDLQIDDPEGNPVLRRRLRPNEIGTISGDMTLPAIRRARILRHQPSQRRSIRRQRRFHVEEYRKPEYAVKVTPQQPRALQGTPFGDDRSCGITSVSPCPRQSDVRRAQGTLLVAVLHGGRRRG